MDIKKLKLISKQLHETGARDSKQFKTLVVNLSTMEAKQISREIARICLINSIDCQALLDVSIDFTDGNVTEEEFRKAINIVLV